MKQNNCTCGATGCPDVCGDKNLRGTTTADGFGDKVVRFFLSISNAPPTSPIPRNRKERRAAYALARRAQ